MVHGHELVSVPGQRRRPSGWWWWCPGRAARPARGGQWSGQSEQAAVRLVAGWMSWDTSWLRMSSVARWRPAPFGHRLGPAPFALQPRGLKAVRTPSARTSGVVGSRTHTRGTPGRPVGRRVPAPGPTDVGGDRLRQLLLCTPTGIVRRCRPVAAEQLKLVWTFSAVLSRRRVVPVGTPAWTAARRPGVVRVGQRVAALVLGPLLRAVRRSLANPGLGPLPVVDVRVGLGLRCDGLGPVPLGYMWAIQGRTI